MQAQTRGSFLSKVALGFGVAMGGATAAASATALDWRFGRTTPPRVSISLPRDWFLTEQLTDVSNPVQLFAISNRRILAPHANVHGTVNPSLIPPDAVLVTASAFTLEPDMAAYALRSSSIPQPISIDDMDGGRAFGDFGLRNYVWAHFGQKFGVHVEVWIGDLAAADDIETLDAVVKSLSFDEPL